MNIGAAPPMMVHFGPRGHIARPRYPSLPRIHLGANDLGPFQYMLLLARLVALNDTLHSLELQPGSEDPLVFSSTCPLERRGSTGSSECSAPRRRMSGRASRPSPTGAAPNTTITTTTTDNNDNNNNNTTTILLLIITIIQITNIIHIIHIMIIMILMILVMMLVIIVIIILSHWPWKGEPQKGGAQKVTFRSLKSDLHATFKWFRGWIPFRASPFQGQWPPDAPARRVGPARGRSDYRTNHCLKDVFDEQPYVFSHALGFCCRTAPSNHGVWVSHCEIIRESIYAYGTWEPHDKHV